MDMPENVERICDKWGTYLDQHEINMAEYGDSRWHAVVDSLVNYTGRIEVADIWTLINYLTSKPIPERFK